MTAPTRKYSEEPCFDDCWGDGIHNAHYHEIDGDGMEIRVNQPTEYGFPKGVKMTDQVKDEDVRPTHKFTVKAEVNFTIRANTLVGAYRDFEKFIAKLFNDAYNATKDPDIVPAGYNGISITKDS